MQRNRQATLKAITMSIERCDFAMIFFRNFSKSVPWFCGLLQWFSCRPINQTASDNKFNAKSYQVRLEILGKLWYTHNAGLYKQKSIAQTVLILTSLCLATYVRWQWHCPHSPAARRCCSNQSISSARRPTAANLQIHGRTDKLLLLLLFFKFIIIIIIFNLNFKFIIIIFIYISQVV